MGDLILNIGKLIKQYESGTMEIKMENEDLYSINQVIELYPMLSKHILTNAINNGDIKVTWLGNKRYFSLLDVDNYLKEKQKQNRNDIPATIESWRNH